MGDELSRLLQSARPSRTPRDARPDAAALAMRDAIVADGSARARVRRHALSWSMATVAVAVLIAVVLVWVPQAPVVAATPRPLSFTPGLTLPEIEARALAAQTGTGGPSEPIRGSESTGWYFAWEEGSASTTIRPTVTTTAWDENGSGFTRVVAGVPYSSDGAPARREADAPAPGELISEIVYGPGEFVPPVSAAPGPSDQDVTQLLGAFGMPPAGATAGEIVTATESVFGLWTLTDEQHAKIISLLLNSPGSVALGESTDRGGRPVFGVGTDFAQSEIRYTVLISAETGRIVGLEASPLADIVPDIPAGSVTSYTLWDLL